MSNIEYPTDGNKYKDIRSWDDLKWADDIYHTPSKIPFFIRPLWYFKTYITICNNAAPHDIEKMNKKWKSMGFFDAIDCTIMDLRNLAYSAKYAKERFERERANDLKRAKYRAERELENNFEEEDRWSAKFNDEERKLCNMPHPRTNGIKNDLTYDQIINRGVIREYFNEQGFGYRVYDKLYCSYWGMIISPHRTYKGKPGGFIAVIYRDTIEEVENAIKVRLDAETKIHCGFKPTFENNSNNSNNSKKPSAANIDHVKKAMGMTKNNEDFNEEIF